MVNEKLNEGRSCSGQSGLFQIFLSEMHLIFSSPAVFLSFFAALFFYLFCVVQGRLLLYIWLFTSAFSGIGLIALCFLKCFSLKNKKKYKNTVFIFAGILIGSGAFLRLLFFYTPAKTLAETEKIETVKLVLTGDPYPAGKKYYAATAKLFSCAYKTKQEFSVKGRINVFFPAEMVRQNNVFGISLYKLKAGNPCKSFSKGAVLSVKGKFLPKKDKKQPAVFFTAREIPLFLGWSSFFARLRAEFRFTVMRLLAGWGSAGGLLLALLSANKDFLETACSVSFRNAGLAHILALSGMHISLISLAAIHTGSLLGRRSSAIKFALILILFFVWFAGSIPSLNRALGMMIILIIGKSLGVKPCMVSVLSGVFVFHIVLKPAEALSLGFMLSYGALTGILIFGKAVGGIFRGKIPKYALNGISASIGAQLFTAPAVISKIGILAPIGIIASVLITPLVSVFLILGMIGVFTALIFPLTGGIFAGVLNFLYGIILSFVRFFSAFPLVRAESFVQKLFFSIVPFCIGLAAVTAAIFFKNKRESIFPQ